MGTCKRRSLSSASKAQSFGPSSLSSAGDAIFNPRKWFSSDPPLPTSKLLSTETTTKSCCTSRFRSLTVLFYRLDAVKKSVERIKAPSLNSVWSAPGRWNPTKWRGLATSATKTFRFVDIDGNPIKKQFRYVAKERK